jgi:hypothetical protein
MRESRELRIGRIKGIERSEKMREVRSKRRIM